MAADESRIFYDRDIEIVKRCQINKMKRDMNVKGMSPRTIREALIAINKIHDNPHICTRCWSGNVYLDGKLVCDCLPDEENKRVVELLMSNKVAIERKDGGADYYITVDRENDHD